MSKKKEDVVRFRLDLVPNLAEKIWNEIGTYANQQWDLPENKELLTSIAGAEETEKLYALTDSAARNVELRALLSKPLKDYDFGRRLRAIEWVVYDWGNVRGKSEKHELWPKQLQNYEPEVITNFILENYQDRIASWSKVLAFADSAAYAIYDARVVMSLNVILDKLGHKQRFYMPSASSDKFNQVFSHIKAETAKVYANKTPVYMGYIDYLDLLNAIVRKRLAIDILEVEMSLFANAYDLAEEYIRKYAIVIKKR
ncbi:hypothetical protein [Flavobacterium sp.]|jgi:hypothetical protein|uniref:hypothetical protein n=1 Tax=Flavobacterium sp. TaxID=239 RepID=UPI0037C19EA2